MLDTRDSTLTIDGSPVPVRRLILPPSYAADSVYLGNLGLPRRGPAPTRPDVRAAVILVIASIVASLILAYCDPPGVQPDPIPAGTDLILAWEYAS